MSVHRAEEVSEQGGLRWLVVGLVLAVLFGTLIRLMVAPHKVEMAIRAQIERSDYKGQIGFRSARVELANGALPDFALVLSDVEWRPMAACESEGIHRADAPVLATSVRLPLRWSSLIRAEFAMGRISAENLVVDLDEVKRRCPDNGSAKSAEVVGRVTNLDTDQPDTNQPGTPAAASSDTAIAASPSAVSKIELFRLDELQAVRNVISGLSINQAELYFEGRMKSVTLENLRANIRQDSVDVSASVRIPPATVFGETLPVFRVKGAVRPREISVQARAELNEGTLEAKALLIPVLKDHGARELDTALTLSVSNLPLSMTTPLLVKSKIAPKGFRPRFAWLDCQAEIKGIFSRLVVDHPLTLSRCEISGQVGNLRVETATRAPDGLWRPFVVRVEAADIKQILETFQLFGAPGVFSEYGKLKGVIEVRRPGEFAFLGSAKGIVVRFAGGEGTALQALAVSKLSVNGSGDKVRAMAEEFSPEGGQASLKLVAEHDLNSGETKFNLNLETLKFNSRVEKALFTGSVADISGDAQGLVARDKIKALRAKLGFKGVQGTEFQAPEIRLEAKLDDRVSSQSSAADSNSWPVEIIARAPLIELPKEGFLYKILKPSFLGWAGIESQEARVIVVNHATVRGRLLESGFRWTLAEASVGPSMLLFSEGQLFRDQVVDAKLESKFPTTNRLAWQVSGTWKRPQFTVANDELRRLLRKPDVTFDSDRDGVRPFETAIVPPRHLGLTPRATGD